MTKPERPPRPLIERIGLFGVALIFGLLFAGMSLAAYVGGELFLALLGALGAVMTVWAGAITLIRG